MTRFVNFLFLFGMLFTFSSCSTENISLAELKEGCLQSGQVLSGELIQTQRGYPYRFMVYLPPCYADQIEISYPVFYFSPGRGSDPAAWFSAGINQIADQLILDKVLSPFIIVITENTNNDSHGSDIYNDLIPYIESEYRVLKNRDYRAVAGGSLGGITSYRLGFQYPKTFSSVGMFGSGAISGEEEQIKVWLDAIPKKYQTRVFMDTGEGDPLMLERAKVMNSLLDQFSVPHFLYTGTGGHDYNYWVSNLEIYFLWVAEGW
jgi:enterochelin esterase-like enzyme